MGLPCAGSRARRRVRAGGGRRPRVQHHDAQRDRQCLPRGWRRRAPRPQAPGDRLVRPPTLAALGSPTPRPRAPRARVPAGGGAVRCGARAGRARAGQGAPALGALVRVRRRRRLARWRRSARRPPLLRDDAGRRRRGRRTGGAAGPGVPALAVHVAASRSRWSVRGRPSGIPISPTTSSARSPRRPGRRWWRTARPRPPRGDSTTSRCCSRGTRHRRGAGAPRGGRGGGRPPRSVVR